MQRLDMPQSKTGTRAVLFGAAVTVAFLLAATPLLDAFEYRTVDLRLRHLATRTPASPDILLVVLDDESLERLRPDLGRWPWPRAIFGAVLDYCSEAAVVGFDILFSEPDWQWPERDQVLVEAAARHGRVVQPVFLAGEGIKAGELPESAMLRGLGDQVSEGLEWPSLGAGLLPFEALLAAGAGLGHVNVEQDPDGVTRRYLLAAKWNQDLVPSLALSVAALYLEGWGKMISWSDRRVIAGAHGTPVTRDGHLRLAYTDCRYPVYGIANVLASWQAEAQGAPTPVPRETFRDKIVLIGSVATGLEADMQVAPVARALPGLLVHANAVDALLRGGAYRMAPPWASVLLLLLMAGLPFVPSVAVPWRMAVTALLLLIFYGLAAYVVLLLGHWMIPVAAPLLGVLSSAGGLSVHYWYRETARRRQLERLEQAKQEFTDMLVHDLKNRVSAITMSLSMLKGQIPAEDAALLRSIRTSQTSASRLLEQVYSLLDIRRMQEGRLALKLEAVDVWALLADCAREHEEAGTLLKVAVRVDQGRRAGPQLAKVDVAIFGRILGNLVWNALNHARRGTDVLLRTEPTRAGHVEVEVANEGRNIPPALQETMFDAFVSGTDVARKSRSQNFGLGLAFCRLACEAHGATIRVESPWADGTEGVRVILLFPGTPNGDGPAVE